MSWEIAFYALNAISGIALVLLAGLAAFRPGSKIFSTLSLFLMAWGAQVALSNLASTAADYATAVTLFWVVQFCFPFQGALLLLYAAESSSRHFATKTCRVLAAAAIACGIVGFLVVFPISPTSILEVQESPGGFSAYEGPLATLFFSIPKFLGIAVALVILGLHAKQDRKHWAILAGLAVAWAPSLARPLSYEIGDTTSLPLLLVLAVALLGIAILVPVRLLAAARRTGDHLAALSAIAIPVAALLAWFGPDATGIWTLLLAPGAYRLLSLAWLVPFLRPENLTAWKTRSPRPEILPLGLCIFAVTIAAAIVGLSALTGLNTVWHTYAGGLAMASLAVILTISAYQVWRLLFPRLAASHS